MDKIINILILLLLLGSCIFNVVLVSDLNKKTTELIQSYEVEPEIIFLDSIQFDSIYITKTEVVRLPIYNTDTVKQTDTIVAVDSVYVEVPIEYKHFSDTLNYNAISFDIRGFQCKVDNLYLKSMKVPIIEQKVPKKWGIGVQLGVGGCKDGFSPYFGVGLSYDLVQF